MGPTTRLRIRDFVLDCARRELRRGSDVIHLSPKALRLLEALAESHPRAVTKGELFDRIWPDTHVAESSLPALINELRTALGDHAREAKIVRTVFGYGYALATEVAIETADDRQSIDSVAVLPFEGWSDDQYIAEGLGDSLINALTTLRGLRVVPRSSSLRYAGRRTDPIQAGRELRSACVVSGRIRATGEDLQVQVELVDVRTERQLWGDRFRKPAGELYALQEALAAAVTSQLERHLQIGPIEPVAPPKAPVPESWRHYLRGRHYANRRDPDSFVRALESFDAAVVADPLFALALAAQAETYVALATRELNPPRPTFEAARAAARRAIDIDPTVASAYTALAATAELYDWKWQEAEELHRRAIDLDRGNAGSIQWLALHLARRRRHEEARRTIERALAVEPASCIINVNAALIAYLAHDIEQAVALAASALDLDPNFEAARLMAGIALTTWDLPRGVEMLEEAVAAGKRRPYLLANLGFAYARQGKEGAARDLRDEIAAAEYVSGANLALISAGLNEVSRALDEFERAADQHSPWLSYVAAEPRLDVVRREPALQKILERIGTA